MRIIFTICMLTVLQLSLPFFSVSLAQESELPSMDEDTPLSGIDNSDLPDRKPPRLSFIEGRISFWRPGAEDWTQAQINTPLAPGDQLYTSSPGNLEIQIGPRSFVRAWENTNLGLENLEPDFVQFKVTSGTAAFDLRSVERGHTLEVNTPNAVFTIEHSGYYRVTVDGDRTSFITRRSGEAIVSPEGADAAHIAPSEEVVVEGTERPTLTSFVAPKMDSWDKWNYARTDRVLDAISSRYVSQDMYGVDELDRTGTWRVVPTYGAVWIPKGVAVGWTPYSTGSWVRDPYYGWTWVDTASWGWAPYQYGRWVSLEGVWAWAPGPLVVRPRYCPALVAFLGGHGGSVGIGVSSGSLVAWVALGWGEPVVPWWGPAHFHRRPYWGGWHGPRIVNNVVVHHTTEVHVHNINVYNNTRINNAVVAVNGNRFGHGRITRERLSRVDLHNFRPIHESPRLESRPQHFVPRIQRGERPPERILQRSVIATRAPHVSRDTGNAIVNRTGPNRKPSPTTRIVKAPDRLNREPGDYRPPFGSSKVTRLSSDRSRPPHPPKESKIRQTPSRSDDRSATTLNRPSRNTTVQRIVRQQDTQRPEATVETQQRLHQPPRRERETPVRRYATPPGQPPSRIPDSNSNFEKKRSSGDRQRQAAPPRPNPPSVYRPNQNEVGSRIDANRKPERIIQHRNSQVPNDRQLPGEPANRLSPSRNPGADRGPSTRREINRATPQPETNVQRRIQPYSRQTEPRQNPSRQTDIRQADPRVRGGDDQNRGRF